MNREKEQRIVFIIGSMGRGGAERVISVLANHYALKGWSVDILLLLDNRCDYELHPHISLIPVFGDCLTRVGSLPTWVKRIRRHIVETNPVSVVSFMARINIITLFACVGIKTNIVVSERTDPENDGRSLLVKMGTYLLYPMAKKVVFQTEWAQSCFPGIVSRKGIVIRNPISVNTRMLEKKEKKIVAVGRLQPEKNHMMLINAFNIARRSHPEYRLFIFGDGPLRSELMSQVSELGLSSCVHLPGSVSNVHEWIADAEIFVLSSNHEGLSNALCEAMLMGLPCISTSCAGSNEIIENGKNGILTDVGDEKQLASAIVSLIEDKEKAVKLGIEAQKTAEHMSKDIVISQWEKIIETD